MGIRLLILLKSGAAKNGLYETAIQRPNAIKEKFKKLKTYQKNNFMLALLRIQKNEYLFPDQVIKLIQRQNPRI